MNHVAITRFCAWLPFMNAGCQLATGAFVDPNADRESPWTEDFALSLPTVNAKITPKLDACDEARYELENGRF